MRLDLPLAALAAACLALCCAAARAGTVQIDTVGVGDALNLADSRTGYGSVPYDYQIGKYDVTMGQYVDFLNSVATKSDSCGLYNAKMATATPSYGITQTSTTAGYVYALATTASWNVPVTYVNCGSAARFVNWLANGEPTGLGEVAGSTETGTYALNGSTGSAALMAVSRSTTATWVLPTVDEWYKAAYYKSGGTSAGYWLYPTQSNDTPSNVLLGSGANRANFQAVLGEPPVVTRSDPVGWLTAVGAFASSPGPYGTFDQGGDVLQWLETALYSSQKEARGGSYAGDSGGLLSTVFGGGPPTSAGPSFGFRVAEIPTSVPEPTSAALLGAAALMALLCLPQSVLQRKRS